MTKWLYKDVVCTESELILNLTLHGHDGWEAWHMESTSDFALDGSIIHGHRIFFKRPAVKVA